MCEKEIERVGERDRQRDKQRDRQKSIYIEKKDGQANTRPSLVTTVRGDGRKVCLGHVQQSLQMQDKK